MSRFWERQPGESQKAYRAFQAYRDMGQGNRSVRKISEQLSYSDHTTCGRWMSKFEWVARCDAYDNWLEMERRSAVEDNERARAVQLAERNRRVDDGFVEVRELMLKKALSIWKWPLERQEITERYEDGRPKTIIVRPARWSFNTGVNLAQALDPNPEKMLEMTFDLSKATDEQLERIANGEDPARVLGNDALTEVRLDDDS